MEYYTTLLVSEIPRTQDHNPHSVGVEYSANFYWRYRVRDTFDAPTFLRILDREGSLTSVKEYSFTSVTWDLHSRPTRQDGKTSWVNKSGYLSLSLTHTQIRIHTQKLNELLPRKTNLIRYLSILNVYSSANFNYTKLVDKMSTPLSGTVISLTGGQCVNHRFDPFLGLEAKD